MLCVLSTSFLAGLVALFRAFQQLLDASFFSIRSINAKH